MVRRTTAICGGKTIGIETIFTINNGMQINIPEKLYELRETGQYPEALMKLQKRQKYCLLLDINKLDYDIASMKAVFYDTNEDGFWKEISFAEGLLKEYSISENNDLIFMGKTLDELFQEKKNLFQNQIEEKKNQRIKEEKEKEEKRRIQQEEEAARQQEIIRQKEEAEKKRQEELEKKRTEVKKTDVNSTCNSKTNTTYQQPPKKIDIILRNKIEEEEKQISKISNYELCDNVKIVSGKLVEGYLTIYIQRFNETWVLPKLTASFDKTLRKGYEKRIYVLRNKMDKIVDDCILRQRLLEDLKDERAYTWTCYSL